tara:strand:- start:155 stop:1282 length:1128 start_codon:yes stop_codon:yes gene_type:complete
MENSTLQKEDVGGIIQQGVSSYLDKNKNISVKDLLTKKSREKAGNQLKSTLKSTALDTGQNVINHLRKEEVSRRKRPSNVRKAKRLEYALLTLKQKKDDAKKAGALKEGDARANKLADAVRSGITTGTISSTSKVKKLDKIITKIRGIKEQVSKMKPSDYKTPGRTHDIKAKEVKDNELATREPDKGSALATQGKRDNEVKDERKPKPYRNKKGKGIKGPSKDAINKTVSKVGSAAKKGLSAFTSGYDNEDVKESKSFKHFTELAATAAITSPIWAPKVAGALMTAVGAGGMIYQSTRRRNKDKSGESGKSLEQRVNAKNSQGAGGSPNQLYRKKTNKPEGDNPEARAGIKDILDKLNKKNNKLYNDYHNPKPPG